MNEIDLFPDDLRRQLMFARWFKRSAFILIIVSLLIVAAFGALRQVNSKLEEDIRYFQGQKEITNTNRNELGRLQQEKNDLQQQLNLLSGLRSGASAEKMFLMLDRALPGPDVWLTNWKFRRAGTQVENVPETVSTGYFIVIPAGSSAREEETWKIETHMNIQGQALDHSAMSKFVLNLTQQPEIEDVRIVSTKLNPSDREKLVDFNLDIIVSVNESRAS